ncbi:MAG TPA: class I tRNA ligase family protein [Solirubrobacteraceae bacterium]|nr:class I tRNA ligase family protein [Solirubrobacteraceae bacterium]
MSETITDQYAPGAIEARWQAAWEAAGVFRTPSAEESDGAPAYIFAACPFTSGSAHMGHIRSYSIADSYARFMRAQGHAVLFSIGYDAFGLPAELEAIRRELPPAEWVARCAERMSAQFRRMGFSFDFERIWFTSEPDMYQWSQKLFLMLLQDGLIYHAEGQVDWCESCHTVLASLQVEDGLCWRCHEPVRLIQRAQWYLSVERYLEENEARLVELEGWNALGLASQRAALGRVDGLELDLRSLDGAELTAFTPHAREQIARAEFVAISPAHPDIEQWVSAADLERRFREMRTAGVQRSDRDPSAVALIDTGRVVSGAGTPAPIPVIVTPAVDARFGPTAVLGIPAVDRTDAALAARLSARPPSTFRVKDKGPSAVRAAKRYRARDFPVSRQRAWGPPIPLVHCERCGVVPVAEADLPVRLPEQLRVSGEGNPLVEDEGFRNVACPRCAGAARRETDTLDCHFDGLWQWLPFCVPRAERGERLFDHPELERWLPVNQVIWGIDGGGSIFDQRMTAKALRDRGLLPAGLDGEPHAGVTLHEMIHLDGRKMSKHLGNIVDPDELVERLGADTVRLAVLYGAAATNALTWSDHALNHCHKWLGQLWRYSLPRLRQRAGDAPGDALPEPRDALQRKLTGWCELAAARTGENMRKLEMHRAVRNVMTLLERIQDFERRALARDGDLSSADEAAVAGALLLLVRLLAPLAPHISEELWAHTGGGLVAQLPSA